MDAVVVVFLVGAVLLVTYVAFWVVMYLVIGPIFYLLCVLGALCVMLVGQPLLRAWYHLTGRARE